MHQKFHYSPTTGVVTRLVRMSNHAAGTLCNSLKADGRYYKLNYMRKEWYLHRFIWLLHTGQEPPEFIDHINGDGLDNRWVNLRAATKGQNTMNTGPRADNVLGIKGVFWDATCSKYRASVAGSKSRVECKFDSIEEAQAWVVAKRAELHGVFKHN